MSWADRFIERGSFAGLPFWAERHRRQGGRRIVVDEYPGSDVSGQEDLGRKTSPLCLNLYIFGDDYDATRDALIDALDAPGPHRLVHPWEGELSVHVPDWTLTESDEDGGLARFSCTFYKAEAAFAPTADAYTPAAVEAATDTALTAVSESFSAGFTVTDSSGAAAPAWVADDAEAGAVEAFDAVGALLGKARFVPDPAAEIAAKLADASSRAAELIRTPFNLAAELTGLANSLAEALEELEDALGLYRFLDEFSITRPDYGPLTANARLLIANRAALTRLVREAGAAAAAKVAPGLSYASRAEALAVLSEWEERLDTLAAEAGSASCAALSDLRASLVAVMRDRAARLPEVVTVTLPQTTPALVLANRLYGPADVEARAAEITARNHLASGLFVPGGRAIEVLNA